MKNKKLLVKKINIKKKGQEEKIWLHNVFCKKGEEKRNLKSLIKKNKWDKVFSKWSLISDDLYQQYQRQKI